MNFATHSALLALALSLCPMAAEETRAPEAILTEIEGVEKTWTANPKATREERQKMVNAYYAERAELIDELHRAAPEHENLGKLMVERIRTLSGLGEGEQALSESNAFLKARPDDPSRKDLVMARLKVLERLKSPQWEDATDRAASDYPKNALVVWSYIRAAERSKTAEDKLRLYSKARGEAKEGFLSELTDARVKRAEQLGKPFEMSFTDTISGEPFDIADHRGKVIVVDFWATWCGPCIRELPKIRKLYEEHRNDGLEVVSVSLDKVEKNGEQLVRDFVKKTPLPWHHWVGGETTGRDFADHHGVNEIPAIFLIDRNGNLHSDNARKDLETLLPELLKSESPTD